MEEKQKLKYRLENYQVKKKFPAVIAAVFSFQNQKMINIVTRIKDKKPALVALYVSQLNQYLNQTQQPKLKEWDKKICLICPIIKTYHQQNKSMVKQ